MVAANEVIGAVLVVAGVGLWSLAIVHVARHTDKQFERAGVAPRMFWLVSIVVLGPVWGAAYLWYAGRRLNRIGV